MRRLLCATALSGTLLLLGACTTSGSADSAADPVSAPVPSAAAGPTAQGVPSSGSSGSAQGDAALKNDTDAICAQATRVSGEFGQAFATDLKLVIDAESSGDKQAIEAAQSKTKRDVQNFSSALGDMSSLANDAAVKKALAAMSKEVSSLQGDVRKLDASALEGLQETLDKACGTA